MLETPYVPAKSGMDDVAALLRRLADQYETAAFVADDPVRFPRAAKGAVNRETTAFVAAALSYGSRPQFLAKIGEIVSASGGDVHGWTLAGGWRAMFRDDDMSCFYRIFPRSKMAKFFATLADVLRENGSLGAFAKSVATDGVGTVEALCERFRESGCAPVVPQDTASACKRLCMFMRWMVRTGSPVDLGLWSWIDRRTLVVPLDVHVAQQAHRLGLLYSKAPTMQSALGLTLRLAEIFPDDPLKGDFALYGLGIDGAAAAVPRP